MNCVCRKKRRHQHRLVVSRNEFPVVVYWVNPFADELSEYIKFSHYETVYPKLFSSSGIIHKSERVDKIVQLSMGVRYSRTTRKKSLEMWFPKFSKKEMTRLKELKFMEAL